MDSSAESSSAPHNADCIDVELASDSRLRLVLAKAEHAQARHQNHGRTGIAQRRRVFHDVLVVVLGILCAIGLKSCLDQLLQLLRLARRIPLDKHWTNLGPNEV